MYQGDEHVHHLLNILKKYYPKISEDWSGTLYCGIHMTWNPSFTKVQLSMPGYIDNLLQKYQHTPTKNQFLQHPCRPV